MSIIRQVFTAIIGTYKTTAIVCGKLSCNVEKRCRWRRGERGRGIGRVHNRHKADGVYERLLKALNQRIIWRKMCEIEEKELETIVYLFIRNIRWSACDSWNSPSTPLCFCTWNVRKLFFYALEFWVFCLTVSLFMLWLTLSLLSLLLSLTLSLSLLK